MATVIDFEAHAFANLRQRIARAEEANEDLIAFARGHRGAVASIHDALLAAADASSLDHLLHIVTQDWPDTLGLDAVALALVSGDIAIRADSAGVHSLDARMAGRVIATETAIVLHDVARGHPLFGPAAGLIRAEALIRLPGEPAGLLALGQRNPQGLEAKAGSELLGFLGAMLSRLIARWPTT